MIADQATKRMIITSPAAIVDNASYTTNEIDTLGYDYLTVDVIIGALDIAFTVLKLQQSDTSGSGFADVTGCIYGTSLGIDGAVAALPSATDDNKIFTFQVDLRGKKRYFDLVATIGDGATGGYMAAVATLSRAATAPQTAAEAGRANILRAA